MKTQEKGRRKANWFLALVGIVILGRRLFYRHVTIEDPVEALVWFFCRSYYGDRFDLPYFRFGVCGNLQSFTKE